jgi:8-oxo-dGTP diphosphatase
MFDPPFRYCPVCAQALVEQAVGGVLRPVCSACTFIVFFDPKVVAVVVVCSEGQFLLGKRSIDPGKGKWSFFGGFVERGEKIEEAALREVKEETNLDVQLEGLIGIYSERGDPHLLIVYQASVSHDQVNTMAGQAEEVSELAFFPLENLPPLAFPVDAQILQDWKHLNR